MAAAEWAADAGYDASSPATGGTSFDVAGERSKRDRRNTLRIPHSAALAMLDVHPAARAAVDREIERRRILQSDRKSRANPGDRLWGRAARSRP